MQGASKNHHKTKKHNSTPRQQKKEEQQLKFAEPVTEKKTARESVKRDKSI